MKKLTCIWNVNRHLNNFYQGYNAADLKLDGQAKIIGAADDDPLIFNQINGNDNLNTIIEEKRPTNP